MNARKSVRTSSPDLPRAIVTEVPIVYGSKLYHDILALLPVSKRRRFERSCRRGPAKKTKR